MDATTEAVERRRKMREKIISLLYAENVQSDCGVERLADELCAIDAVEVVRCRNCEWWCKDPDGITYCELNSTRCGGNHFCSFGERKEYD